MALQIFGGLFGISLGGAVMAACHKLELEALLLAICAAASGTAIFILAGA